MPILAFTGCGKDDDDEPNVPDQSLKVGQSFTIPVEGAWESDNKFIASVEGATVKGVCAGETSIRNGKQSFKVTVQPTFFLYKDPYLQFGASKSKVKDFMKGFEEVETDNESLNFFYLEGTNPVMYIYMFENAGLKSTGVFLPTKMATSAQIADYLTERFIPVGSNSEIIAMVSPDKTIAVGVTVQKISGTLMYEIIYLPYSSTKSNGNDLMEYVKNGIIHRGESVNDVIDVRLFE